MTKDQDETKRTVGKLAETQSKMTGDIASGRAENATSFDALAKMMATMQSAIQGNQQRGGGAPGSGYVVTGHCKVCKSTGHDRHDCPLKGADKAAEAKQARESFYGKKNDATRIVTDLVTSVMHPETQRSAGIARTEPITFHLNSASDCSTGSLDWSNKEAHSCDAPQEQAQQKPAHRISPTPEHMTGSEQEAQIEAQVYTHVELASKVSAANKQSQTETNVLTHTATPPSAAEHTERTNERQDNTMSYSDMLSPGPQQRQVPMAAATDTEAASTAGTATATGAQEPNPMEQAAQAWSDMFSMMSSLSPPMAVVEAAQTAMTTTATPWAFRAADAVEAVIQKIVSQSPLTFINPHLGTVLRTIAGRYHGHPS